MRTAAPQVAWGTATPLARVQGAEPACDTVVWGACHMLPQRERVRSELDAPACALGALLQLVFRVCMRAGGGSAPYAVRVTWSHTSREPPPKHALSRAGQRVPFGPLYHGLHRHLTWRLPVCVCASVHSAVESAEPHGGRGRTRRCRSRSRGGPASHEAGAGGQRGSCSANCRAAVSAREGVHQAVRQDAGLQWHVLLHVLRRCGLLLRSLPAAPPPCDPGLTGWPLFFHR